MRTPPPAGWRLLSWLPFSAGENGAWAWRVRRLGPVRLTQVIGCWFPGRFSGSRPVVSGRPADFVQAPGKPVFSRRTLAPLWRWSLLVIGFVSVVLGVLGIFLPVLPTVPLLLLALACFARSSERFYFWLLNHRRLGPMVRPYLEGSGIPVRIKIRVIALLWASIAFSSLVLVDRVWVRLLLPIIALAITIYLIRLPSAAAEQDS